MRPLIGRAAILFFSLSQLAIAQAPRPIQERFAKPQPFTIRGKATNHEGKPVAGAAISILCTNRLRQGGLDPLVAKTVTDATGVFLLQGVPLPILAPDGGPIKKYSEGAFQVIGTAVGYGFTWHPEQFVRPEMRPAESNTGSNLFYAGEDCIANLAFDLPATIQGQITNDRDEPLMGVKVEVGYVHNFRRPGTPGASSCRYLGPPNATGDPPADSFSGMDRLPQESREAVTDRDGRYKVTGLRRETVYWAQIDYLPETNPLSLYVATTSGTKGDAERRVGYDGVLDHIFAVPPTVTVQIAGADSGNGVANVTVRAKRKQILRGGNVARSDAAGRAILHLPADGYTLFIEPAPGATYLPRETELVVTGDPREQTIKVTLEPGASIALSAFEAETGKPLAGVSYFQETDAGNDRRSLHSQTVVADYPETDDKGELRAVLPPGRVRFVVDKSPPGYEPVRAASELLTLAAGQMQAARFEFRKTAAVDVAAPSDELSALRELLARQRNLPKSGTYLIKQAFITPLAIAPGELRRLVDGWNPAAAPDFFAALRQQVPEASFREARVKVVMHGEKQRNESVTDYAGFSPGTRISVSNGHENVVYDPANVQASLTPAIVGTTPQRFGPSPSVFYTLPSIAYTWANRGGLPTPQLTRQAGKLILERGAPSSSREIIEEETGFLHHSWSQSGNGFGREAWYFSPRRMDTGLILAGLTIQCQFTGDKLTMLQVTQLEEVTLETPPPEAFVVSAPAGTNVVDSRQRGSRPKIEMVNYPVADVVMVANRIPDDSRSILPVLKIGQPAPPLEPVAWLNAAGQTAPPDQKGKVVLVDFWGIFCGPCIAELPDVQTLATEFAKESFLLIGLHESSVEVSQVAEFARKRSITYPLAIDRPAADSLGFGAAFKAYGIQGIPSCAVIDQQGRIAYVGRFQQAAIEVAKLLEKQDK